MHSWSKSRILALKIPHLLCEWKNVLFGRIRWYLSVFLSCFLKKCQFCSNVWGLKLYSLSRSRETPNEFKWWSRCSKDRFAVAINWNTIHWPPHPPLWNRMVFSVGHFVRRIGCKYLRLIHGPLNKACTLVELSERGFLSLGVPKNDSERSKHT